MILFRGQMFLIGLQTRDIVNTFENYQPSTKQDAYNFK